MNFYSVTLLTGLVAPFIIAVVVPWAFRTMGRRAVVVPLAAALISFLSLGLLLSHIKHTTTPLVVGWNWVEPLALKFSFSVDGFGGLFAMMVVGIGILIIWYAHHYMEHEQGKGRFFAFLLFFMGSMQGIALSEHIFTTFLFWELTSISSFFLIGFWHGKEKSRAGALKALLITSIGGLVMMAGLALLGIKSGHWEWSALAQAHPDFAGSPWMTWAFVLILVGVFTKSAQFPFHIWLPDAMEAPTPVSAFLHSATMVKAGVFLLFRLHPIFFDHQLWFPVLMTVGMTTVVLGSVMALRHVDLKAILAYTTVSQLGIFVVLHSYTGPTEAAAVTLRAGIIFQIIVHAFYKGSLFMLTGIIDHAAHTRDIHKLGFLNRSMPRTAVFLILAACSLAGFPPFLSFISKEVMFETLINGTAATQPQLWIFPLAMLLSAAITVGVALKLAVGVVFLPPQDPEHNSAHPPHEVSWSFLCPPAILAVLGLVLGIFPHLLTSLIYPTALVGMDPGAIAPHMSLWHGFNLPLAFTGVAVLGGAAIFFFRQPIFRFQEQARLSWNLNTVHDWIWEKGINSARRLTDFLQNASLSRYISVVIGFTALLLGMTAVTKQIWLGYEINNLSGLELEAIVVLGLCVCTVLVVRLKDRISRIIALSAAGILLCAFFTFRGAPDLALTGFLVEIVMFIVILIVLNQLKPEPDAPASGAENFKHGSIAVFGGLSMGGLVFLALQFPLAPSIHPYFLENSNVLAGGLNVVNVILVDFRGFDTMGEILVLCLAGLGVFALRRVWVVPPTAPAAPLEFRMKSLPPSQILTPISAAIFPFILIFSLYMLFRGHNQPGGGFIAGLIAASGLVLELLSAGRKRFLDRFPIEGRTLFLIGLSLAFLTGLAPLFLNYPFLTSVIVHSIHFSTASIFDIGVYMTVVGVALEIVVLMEDRTAEVALK